MVDRSMRGPRAAFVTAVLTAAVLGPAAPAQAAAGSGGYLSKYADATAHVIKQTQVDAHQGQKLAIEAKVVLERSSSRILVSVIVTCDSGYSWSSQNLRAGQKLATLWVRDLHVARSGPTASCALQVWARSPGPDGHVRPQDGFQVNLTRSYLRLQGAPDWARAYEMPARLVNGTTAVYTKPLTVPEDIRKIRCVADLEMTNCYSSSGGCRTRYNKLPSRFTVQQVVIQLNANGGACKITRGPVRQSTIDWEVHHKKIYNSLDVAVNPKCPSKFKAGVRVVRTAYNPVLIEDGRWTSSYISA